jgi:hypothetical protein
MFAQDRDNLFFRKSLPLHSSASNRGRTLTPGGGKTQWQVKGDELIVSFWKTTDKMLLNNVGYTEYVFKQLGAVRTVPNFGSSQPSEKEQTVALQTISNEARALALSSDENSEVKEAFSEYFMQKVTADESYRYKLTTAIGEMHLGDISNHEQQFAGILYPSVQMNANGDNLALLPQYVDTKLEFRKAVHVRITDTGEKQFKIENVDAAHSFDENGKLAWLGRVKNWTLDKPFQRAKLTLTAGLDEDGDYTLSSEGEPAHWVATDDSTGEVIQPK